MPVAPILDSIELVFMIISYLDQCNPLCPRPPAGTLIPHGLSSPQQTPEDASEHLSQVPPCPWALKMTRAFTESEVGAQVSDDGGRVF